MLLSGLDIDNYCIYQQKHIEYDETIELVFGGIGADDWRQRCGSDLHSRRAHQAARASRQTAAEIEKEGKT